MYQLHQLRFQYDYSGAGMINRQVRVCPSCYDIPQRQLGPAKVSADPYSVSNARQEQYLVDEISELWLRAPGMGVPMFRAASDLQAELTNLGKLLFPEFTATGEMQAALMRGIDLAPSLDGTGVLSVSMSYGASLVAALDGSSDLSAALSYGAVLSPGIDGVSDLAVSMLLGIGLSASVDGVSDLAATLTQTSPVSSISQVLSAASEATTITAPSGIQAGDVIVLSDRANNFSGTPSLVTPSGFSSINSLSDTFTRVNLSYKIATGSEGGTSITGMAGTDYVTKLMYVFRGNAAIVAVTPASVAGQITNGNPTAQNVTSSSGAVPLVVIATYSSYAATVDPRTMSPAKDGEITTAGGDANSAWLAYKIYNSSPANVSVDMDDEGDSNALQSCYLQCS